MPSAWPHALRRPWVLALLLVAAVAAALVWSRTRAAPVTVLSVRAAPLTQSLAVSGRVVSENRVFVGSTVTGRVAEVTRREGGTLREGELIVRLEDAELVAAVHQATAGLASAQARLASQRRLAAPVATQQLEQARANAAAADREVQRTEQLLAQGFIGQARLDEVKRVAEVAQAALRSAQVQQEANVSGTELLQAEARVTEARAAVELARARLAQTRITSPAEATVLARLVEPGQIVQPGTRLAELGVRGPVQLVALVDEKYLARLSPWPGGERRGRRLPRPAVRGAHRQHRAAGGCTARRHRGQVLPAGNLAAARGAEERHDGVDRGRHRPARQGHRPARRSAARRAGGDGGAGRPRRAAAGADGPAHAERGGGGAGPH